MRFLREPETRRDRKRFDGCCRLCQGKSAAFTKLRFNARLKKRKSLRDKRCNANLSSRCDGRAHWNCEWGCGSVSSAALSLRKLTLLRGTDAVAFLETGAGDDGADRRLGIDICCLDDANGGGELADDFASGGILDLLRDAESFEQIARHDTGACSDVQDDLTAVDSCGNAFRL